MSNGEAQRVIDAMGVVMIGLFMFMACMGMVAVRIILQALDVILAEIRMGREPK